jgi:hypothetical protein
VMRAVASDSVRARFPCRVQNAAGLAVLPRRGAFFAGLCAIGFANGIVPHVMRVVADDPWGAIFDTFGISALVWIAAWNCIATMLVSREGVRNGDVPLGLVATVAFLSPVDWPSWIALTTIALYLLRQEGPARSGDRSPLYRAAWVLLAITGAMFWGRMLLTVASTLVLQAETAAVSWMIGASRMGNTLSFADGAGYVWIAGPCSSVANISLALLCWVMLAQHRRLRWSPVGAAWCLFAIASVAGINTLRLGLIVLHRDWFELLHGPVGSTVAGWLIVIVTVAICFAGTRHAAGLARR